MMRISKCIESPRERGGSVFGFGWFGAVLVFMSLAGSFLESSHGQAPAGNGDGAQLKDLIAKLRQENKLVGLAAMVVVDGRVVDSAVDGERKKGSRVPLEIGDRWHLGSVTKSITATMIARLVESGQMKWSDSIGKCFPDAAIHEDWKPVTLKQLLTHTAGAPANFSFLVRLRRPELGRECTRARREAVLKVIARKPAHPPGEKFAYSNVGYTIAGAMAEDATGATWEELVTREVFKPLQLAGVGFGPPRSSAKTLEQPRGHQSLAGLKVAVDDKADNTPIISPAGSVHMTLDDLCKYATEHLRGDLGKGKLLSAKTYKLLHTPALGRYARGWVKKEPGRGIPHTVYWHNGSNTMWYALVAFIPEKRMVVAVTSNDGDVARAEAAAWEIVKAKAMPAAKVRANRPQADPLQSINYPKKSPFAAVRWQQSQPEVQLGEEWFKLVSLNELTAAEIVAFSKRKYGKRWRRRFEEDLVELLTLMKHPPRDKVKLVVESLTSAEKSVREDVPMTEANRRAIRAMAQKRSADAKEPAADDSVFVAATVLDIKILARSATPKEIAGEIHTKVAYHVVTDWAKHNKVRPTPAEIQELFASEARKIPKELYETKEGKQRMAVALFWAKGSAIDWVTAKALHEKFGGPIATSSFGAYTAIEGRYAVLKDYAAKGKIKFVDAEIEKYFWNRINDPRVLDVTISDPKRIASRFAKPPWEGWGARTSELLKKKTQDQKNVTHNP